MSQPPVYQPRRPERAPTTTDLAERDAFAALVTNSLPAVRASAEAWRNGLTAFITLVTTGVVIKGRDTTASLTSGWRVVVTVLIGGGLLLAVLGLWQALGAQAGTRAGKRTLADIHAEHASVAAYQVSLADTAASKLRNARRAVAAALALLLLGVGATWWAPTPRASPVAYLRVSYSQTTSCGTLQSADGGYLRLAVQGVHAPVVIPLIEITNLTMVSQCG